jgi:hypothetical protein
VADEEARSRKDREGICRKVTSDRGRAACAIVVAIFR